MAQAAQLTSRQIEELENTALRAKDRVAKIKAQADAAVHRVVSTAEIATAAFTMGVIDGRYGGVEVLGVPLSLGSAAAAHLAAFLGIAPDHLHAFGNGFLASYLSNLGNGVGAKMALEAAAALQAQAAQAQAAANAARAAVPAG